MFLLYRFYRVSVYFNNQFHIFHYPGHAKRKGYIRSLIFAHPLRQHIANPRTGYGCCFFRLC